MDSDTATAQASELDLNMEIDVAKEVLDPAVLVKWTNLVQCL
jgi:hypothetical protein